MFPIWPIFRLAASREVRRAALNGFALATGFVIIGVNREKFSNLQFPVQRDGTRNNIPLNPMMLNSDKKDTKELRKKAEIGQEAHRQEQKKIREQGGETEVPMELKDGTKVRKDGVDADGTLVIIKPDTKSGRASAKKREKLLDDNDKTNHRTILYDPKTQIICQVPISI